MTHNGCNIVESFDNFRDYYNGTDIKGTMQKGVNISFWCMCILCIFRTDIFSYILFQLIDVNVVPAKIAWVFRYKENAESADLLDTYLGFPPSCYIPTILSFFVFLFTWNLGAYVEKSVDNNIKKELDGAREPGYWLMTCAILDQNQFPDVSKVVFTAM